MHAPALPAPMREQAEHYLAVCRIAAQLGEAWAAWMATRPDPAVVERVRADIGEMLRDRVSCTAHERPRRGNGGANQHTRSRSSDA